MSLTVVETVRGSVALSELGTTLPHEHVFLDQTCNVSHPTDPELMAYRDSPLTIDSVGALRNDPMVFAQNLVLDNESLAMQELKHFRRRGGQTLWDVTPIGLKRDPVGLRRVSEALGLHIVMGTGFYTEASHPDWVRLASIEELAAFFVRELREGSEGTDIRAGIIGELGTTNPLMPGEVKVLHAASLAHKESGSPVSLHMEPFSEAGLEALDLLLNDGIDPLRLVAGHSDTRPDPTYCMRVAKRGVFVELDTFGMEWYFDHLGLRCATDAERISMLLALLDHGYEDRILLSQDVCTKCQLLAYGGQGYGHLTRNIEPRLKRLGVNQALLYKMRVTNPASVLAGR